MRFAMAVLFAALTLPSAAQTQERVLLPIAFKGEVAGAFGTRWTTLTLIWNDGTDPVELSVNDTMLDPLSPRTYRILQPDTDESQGAIVSVTRGANVKFAALLRDMARTEENSGTELPIVRESQFANRIVLPIVLLRGPWRTALRIYSYEPVPVRIRMYRLDRLEPFVDEVVVLHGNDPSYFHIFDLIARWPQLEAAASTRIELESDGKIWAFASQTNNATQLVTTVRPQ